MSGALVPRLLAVCYLLFSHNFEAAQIPSLGSILSNVMTHSVRNRTIGSSRNYRMFFLLPCQVNNTRGGSDSESNDLVDGMKSNTTIEEPPKMNDGGKSYYVSTSAFLMATIPMITLVAAFVAECHKPSAGARNAYASSRSMTESCEEDDKSLSADDRNSETSSKNTLFLHVVHNPQNVSRSSSFHSCPPDPDECSQDHRLQAK